jgi:hypothetical protein
MKYYPGEHNYYTKPRMIYERTGEFRAPRKGEYYLSGAIPCAYRAQNDLSTDYHIMRPIAERRHIAERRQQQRRRAA